MIRNLPLFLIAILCSGPFAGHAQQLPCNPTIFSLFTQGKQNNCASVALIKAALNVYGVDSVFDEQTLTPGLYRIKLKNGQQYTLTDEEINQARRIAKINCSNKKVLDYVVRCYAVMAKVRQTDEHLSSYKKALKHLSRGAYTPNVYEYLGLEGYVKLLEKEADVKNLEGIVAWSDHHAVFVCNGDMDEWGKKNTVTPEYYGRFQLLRDGAVTAGH